MAQYFPGRIEDKPDAKNPDGEWKYGCVFTLMPSFLSDHEIEAIRKGSVFVGMSRAALYMAIGFPKTTNDSLRGLTQLVYASSYVYLDSDRKVVDVQTHD
jgi:hypothetical protein